MSNKVVKSKLPGFTFGCDPEVFVVNSRGRAVSAEGLLPGTKEEPYPVEGGAVQVDGMAAEYNIDPVSNYEDFRANNVKVLEQLEKMLPTGYKIRIKPSVVFDKKIWEESPDVAKILGCSPDFNAWTGKTNPPPNAEAVPRLRTASGHLHIGWTEGKEMDDVQHIFNCQSLVRQLDYYLGVWSVTKDKDTTRRELYGKAGACRYKPYGVEYRVLSNFWLTSETRMRDTWNRMVTAVNRMSKECIPDHPSYRKFNKRVVEAIDTSTVSSHLYHDVVEPLTRIN